MARPPPSGSGSDRRNLEELEMPNRQIQLTAAYLKKLSGVLRHLETYVSGQFSSIINYAAARRSGEPISTAQTESAVHRLPHRRMTAKRQMRWSPKGAHFMLKVRTSVMNGTFEQTTLISPNRRAASNVVPHNTPNFETVSSVQKITNLALTSVPPLHPIFQPTPPLLRAA